MAEERIDIVITDKVSPKIEKSIARIGTAAIKANKSIRALSDGIKAINIGPIARLAAAQTKVQNATARLINAKARQQAVDQRQQVIDQKLLVGKNKLKISLDRITISENNRAASASRAASAASRAAAAESRVTIATSNAAAAQSRASVAANRLTGAHAKLVGTTNSLSAASIRLRSILTSLFILYGFRGVIRLSDEYTSLTNRLRIVTDSSAQLADVTEKLFEISRRSRAPVLEVTTAYQRFFLALVQLGAEQEEVLRFTETVTKAVAISGLTAGEAANGIRQFSQAMNKGKLDGEEFRSVMENVPILADAIAKEMGVARGELLKLAPQGLITGEILRKSIAGASDQIQASFAELNPTIAQATTLLRNSAVFLLEDFNNATDASENFASAIIFLSENLKDFAKVTTVTLVPLATYFALMKVKTLIEMQRSVAAVTVATALQGPAVSGLAARWLALNAVIRANPFIFAVTALAAVTTAISLWGDESKDTEEDLDKLDATARRVSDALLKLSRPPTSGKEKPFVPFDPSLPADLQRFGSALDVVTEDFNGLRSGTEGATNVIAIFNDVVARSTEQLKKQADLLKLTDRERGIEEKVQKELKKLTGVREEDRAAVEKAIREQVRLNQGFKEQRDILTKLDKPLEDHIRLQENLAALTVAGAISQEKANTLLGKSRLALATEDVLDRSADDPNRSQTRQLERRLSNETQILKDARDAELLSEEQFLSAKQGLEDKFAKASNKLKLDQIQIQTNAAASLFSSLAAIAKNAEGENSSRAKRLFQISKAAAIANIIISTQQSAAESFKNAGGWPAGIIPAAAAVAAGVVQLQTVQAQKFAHGGLVRGPGGPQDDLVQANLSNGEFVVRAESVRQNRALLERINSNSGSIGALGSLQPQTAGNGSRPLPTRGGGGGGNIVVNIRTLPGTTAKVSESQRGGSTNLDIIIQEVDTALANNLAQGNGALTQEINEKTSRNF